MSGPAPPGRDRLSPDHDTRLPRGRVIKELNLRRTDLIISTKIFFGTRSGPNDKGLSRKQCVFPALPGFPAPR